MSKFEWMELETLSSEITHTQNRLDAARATKNLGLVQLLERELAEALTKRAQVLADITKGLGFTGPKAKLVNKPVRQPEHVPLEQSENRSVRQPERVPAQPMLSTKEVQPQMLSVTGSDGPAFGSSIEKGDNSMWEKLTAADLERVKRGLAARRSEMLTRHAEELKALEGEQREIDVIEQAIAAFTQKFKMTSIAEVIPLEGERVPVQAD
jgi:hypothetical protein